MEPEVAASLFLPDLGSNVPGTRLPADLLEWVED